MHPCSSRPDDLVDALLADAPSEMAWARGVVEISKAILPSASAASLHVLELDRDLRAKRQRLSVPIEYAGPVAAAVASRQMLCPAGLTLGTWARGSPLRTCLQLVTHHAEHVVTCVLWYFDEPPAIDRAHRLLLERLAFHLDAAQRMRQSPESVRAVLSDRGEIEYLQPDARELWPALLEGRVGIARRRIGAREEYLVIDNSPAARVARALSLAESATLRLASQGMSNKLMAYGLGISSTAVSRHLASAATKLGLASRAELIRVAALLVEEERGVMTDEVLTSAEREILALLRRGLSNQEIALRRERSVRTIANQVASLLRKTGSASRRELTVRRGSEHERRHEGLPDVAE